MYETHLRRIQDGVNSTYTLSTLSTWISRFTKHEGKRFSYTDHEYQPLIIDDPAKTLYVIKAAQTGMSEIFARWAVAACTTQPNFTLIWTFPSSSDAEKFTKARLNPIIASSPEIQIALSKDVNSVELKQFGENSFAYVRGTLSDTGGLSVPADLLIHDELDKSDLENIATYVSRLQHKPTKMRRLFSTPTQAGYGIHLLCKSSKRKIQMWKCSHCNHNFIPSYEHDVHIPGYDGKKKDVTKTLLSNLDWRASALLCPRCGRQPDIAPNYREWVIENPTENFEAVSYHISPFCAPAIITPSYLVNVSTEFNKWSEFQNQALGLVAEDADETLTRDEVQRSITTNLDSSAIHQLGVDIGVTCHLTVGRLQGDRLLVVHREKVYYTQLEERRRELMSLYKISTSVHDYQPYTDMIARITEFDPNAYGARYEEVASTNSHRVKEVEEDPEEGKLNLRMTVVNRTVALDELMGLFKKDLVSVADSDGSEEFVDQLQDMKRVKQKDKFGRPLFRWVKTTGADHWHHSLLYMYIACKLRGTANAYIEPHSVPLVRRFRPDTPELARRGFTVHRY